MAAFSGTAAVCRVGRGPGAPAGAAGPSPRTGGPAGAVARRTRRRASRPARGPACGPACEPAWVPGVLTVRRPPRRRGRRPRRRCGRRPRRRRGTRCTQPRICSAGIGCPRSHPWTRSQPASRTSRRCSGGLHALGHRPDAQGAGERHDRGQDRAGVTGGHPLGGGEQGPVDLQRADRQRQQLGQRGPAGAEVVDRHPHAHAAQHGAAGPRRGPGPRPGWSRSARASAARGAGPTRAAPAARRGPASRRRSAGR